MAITTHNGAIQKLKDWGLGMISLLPLSLLQPVSETLLSLSLQLALRKVCLGQVSLTALGHIGYHGQRALGPLSAA